MIAAPIIHLYYVSSTSWARLYIISYEEHRQEHLKCVEMVSRLAAVTLPKQIFAITFIKWQF